MISSSHFSPGDIAKLKKLQFCFTKGLFTWREEDPSTRKIREGGKLFVCFTCRNFGRRVYQVEKEKKDNCRPLAAGRPAAAMFFFLSLVLGSSERKSFTRCWGLPIS